MNGITFQRGQGGLGRKAPGEDHVSALLFYINETISPPTGTTLIALERLDDATQYGISITKTPVVYYHIAEFFRIAPSSKLLVRVVNELQPSIKDVCTPNLFSELKEMQQQSKGIIRQVGVWLGHQDQVKIKELNDACEELAAQNMPLSAVVAYKIDSTKLDTITDLGANSYPRVSVCIAQDGGGLGAYLQKNAESLKP